MFPYWVGDIWAVIYRRNVCIGAMHTYSTGIGPLSECKVISWFGSKWVAAHYWLRGADPELTTSDWGWLG